MKSLWLHLSNIFCNIHLRTCTNCISFNITLLPYFWICNWDISIILTWDIEIHYFHIKCMQVFLKATYSLYLHAFGHIFKLHHVSMPQQEFTVNCQRAVNTSVKSVLTWFTEITRKHLAILFQKNLVNNSL